MQGKRFSPILKNNINAKTEVSPDPIHLELPTLDLSKRQVSINHVRFDDR